MEKRKFHSLQEDINLIIEIPERVNTLDLIHLKELSQHIKERQQDLIGLVNEQLMTFTKENYPDNLKEEDYFNYRFSNTIRWGTNGVQLNQLENIINKRIDYLVETSKLVYKRINFDNLESEQFFEHTVKHWLSIEDNTRTAINYVFGRMWEKSDNNFDFTIVGTSTAFAKYWNKKYPEIYKFPYPKNPKFKDITTIPIYYERKFNFILSDYLK